MKKIAFLLALLPLLSLSAFAKPQTVTLAVPTMSCSTCPFVVKMTLERVDGVIKAEATLRDKLAVVTFDDEKTTVNALTQATTNAGYPSMIQE